MYEASNPGNVRLEWNHFLRWSPNEIGFLVVMLLVGGVSAVFKMELGLVLVGAGVFGFFFGLIQARTAFRDGDTLPAIVIDAKRRLVASYTNLSKTGGFTPALKVFTLPIVGLPGVSIKTGTRLAYVVLYNGNERSNDWMGFGGWFVQQGTPNRKLAQRKVESISEDEWQILGEAINLLPKPYPVGLWKLRDLKKGRIYRGITIERVFIYGVLACLVGSILFILAMLRRA